VVCWPMLSPAFLNVALCPYALLSVCWNSAAQVERLQEKFANIHHHLSSSQGVLSSPKDVTEEMSMFKIS